MPGNTNLGLREQETTQQAAAAHLACEIAKIYAYDSHIIFLLNRGKVSNAREWKKESLEGTACSCC